MSATTNAAGVPDGWLIDGSLLYRLNDIGVNCDEINVTMADGSRKDGPRAKRAQEILAAITLHADRITALEAKCDLLAASLKQADAVKGQLVAALKQIVADIQPRLRRELDDDVRRNPGASDCSTAVPMTPAAWESITKALIAAGEQP